jgi:hypothetical protein
MLRYTYSTLPVLVNALSDPLGSRACAEHRCRASPKQWLDSCVNGCAKVGWLPVLQTTFVGPGQTGPPQLICYNDTVYRYHMRNEFKQWVILINNVNLVYSGSGGRAVWRVCLGLRGWWDRGSNPVSHSPDNDWAGMIRMKQHHYQTLGFC